MNTIQPARRQFVKQCGLALMVLASPFPFNLTAKEKFQFMIDSKSFDVIIIGGSYAGLSAAMALGRSLRKVLIIDSGLPCNRQTPHAHNFLTRDGETPHLIAEQAKTQVLTYDTVTFFHDIALSGKKTENGFFITTQSRETFYARQIIFATGVKDIMPDIEGFAECWGISVVHCPYCHGYEIRNERTGILANGKAAAHYAQLISNWTKDLIVFTNGKSTLTAEETEKITRHNIPIIEKEIDCLKHENGKMQQIIFKDGSTFELRAVYHKPEFEQHCKIAQQLGCELTEHGLIAVDNTQKTNVENILACGDCTSPLRSVANAVATGNLAGAMANSLLTEHEF